MKKTLSMLTAALLCLALFAGCRTNAGLPNPDATTFHENAPPTTDAEATTKPATTHFKDADRPHRLLEYKMDENGIFYIDRPIWMDYFSIDQIVYGTVCVKFRYDQKDWLIQMWKGRYGLVMLGGEICVATKPAAQGEEAYALATSGEALALKMDVYQHDFSANKTTHLFTRGPERAGWFSGFVPGKFYEENKKSEIIMVGSITFPNEEMLRAFEEPFAAAGFEKGTPGKDSPETYSINGTKLAFSWQYLDQSTR